MVITRRDRGLRCDCTMSHLHPRDFLHLGVLFFSFCHSAHITPAIPLTHSAARTHSAQMPIEARGNAQDAAKTRILEKENGQGTEIDALPIDCLIKSGV